MANVVFSNSTSAVRWRDQVVMLSQGDIWDAEDTFVKERPEFFNDQPEVLHHTNVPRKAVKKAAVKKAAE